MKKSYTPLKLIFCFVILQNMQLYPQWQQSSNGIEGKNISSFYINNNVIWAGIREYDYNIYKSTNEGNSWLLFYSNDFAPVKFVTNSGNIFYLGSNYYGDDRVYKSSNNGSNWENVSGNVPNEYWDIIAFNNELFLASYGHGVYKSISGINWQACNNGLNSLNIQALGYKDNYIFVGTRSNGIAVSSNSGGNWEPANNGLNYLDIRGFCTNSINIFAYTDKVNNGNGIYSSSNYGQNWQFKGLANKEIQSLVSINNAIFALVYNEGIYRSLDNGNTWMLINEGLTNLRTRRMINHNNYLYLGTGPNNSGADKSIWKRPVNEVIGINQISGKIPDKFNLSQNYPNPFNPSTNIKFDIPKTSGTKLIIYDITGSEIATLVDGKLGAGSYEVTWNATNYSSGQYFYKLQSGDFVHTKKMIVLK